jgi:hypothetical protein
VRKRDVMPGPHTGLTGSSSTWNAATNVITNLATLVNKNVQPVFASGHPTPTVTPQEDRPEASTVRLNPSLQEGLVRRT